MDYFKDYSGGIEDVKEAFNLFSEVVEKSIIPDLPITELERIKAIFPADKSMFLKEVSCALFNSMDLKGTEKTEMTVRKLRDGMETIANDASGDLERSLLYTLRLCTGKIAALLARKRVIMLLEQKTE